MSSRIDQAISLALNGSKLDCELSREKERFSESIQQCRNRLELAIRDANALGAELSSVPVWTAPDVSDLLAQSALLTHERQNTLTAAKAALQAFRVRHGRIELAKQPSKMNTILACGAACVVEAGVNAAFFLNAHLTAGPLGAMLTSTFISTTNICVSTSAGYFVGRWFHWGELAPDGHEPRFRLKRIKAKILFGGYLVIIGGFHTTVGLIRAQESLHDIVHSLEAYLQAITTPESLFLILAGVCMSAFAYIKGVHGFDDAYPEYGAYDRQVRNAEEDLIAVADDAAGEINDRFDDALSQLKKDLSGIAKDYKAYNQGVIACFKAEKALKDTVQKAKAQLRTEVATLAGLYKATQGQTHFSINEDDLEGLCDLSESFHYDMPSLMDVPDSGSLEEVCAQERVRALKQLASCLDQKGAHS